MNAIADASDLHKHGCNQPFARGVGLRDLTCHIFISYMSHLDFPHFSITRRTPFIVHLFICPQGQKTLQRGLVICKKQVIIRIYRIIVSTGFQNMHTSQITE